MNGSVCGYVVHSVEGTPIRRATVRVLRGPGTRSTTRTVTSDQGAFSLCDLAEGKWFLSATSPEGHSRRASVHVFKNALSELTIEIGQTSDDLAEPKMKTGSVKGRVIDQANSQPIPDVAITVKRSAGPAPDISALTNHDGRFQLDDLPAGECVLKALAPDGATSEITLQVIADTFIKALIKLDDIDHSDLPEID